MKKVLCIFMVALVTGCAGMPVGMGNRMHVCGTIVDEDLKPIKEPLIITTRVQLPIMRDAEDVVQTESHKTVTNGKFCVDAYNALRFVSFVSAPNIMGDPISGMLQPVNVNDFKWVVDRSDRMGKRPNFDARYLLRAGGHENVGHSTYSGTILYIKDGSDSMTVSPLQIKHIVEGAADTDKNIDTAKVHAKWENLSPNTLAVMRGGNRNGEWILGNGELITDFRIQVSGDTLRLLSGPLVKTKFIPASLDSPICNFGRLPGPPPLTDSRWRDSLSIAMRDTIMIDAFYVYSPENQRWGKVLFKPKITRDSRGVEIQFAKVIKPLSDTSSFLFWRVDDPGFQDRQKCLTKVEAYRAMPEYKGQWEKH